MKTLHNIIFFVLAFCLGFIVLALASLELANWQLLSLIFLMFTTCFALFLNNYIINLKK